MTSITQTSETENKLDDIIKPPIYSKRTIWGFSVLFTPLFGGILLMQNLKDIDKKKEANIVLLISIAITTIAIIVVTVFETPGRSIPMLLNFGGGALLAEYFYKKYFPDEESYQKKKIWKPLIIGIIIILAFIALTFYAQDQVLQ